MQVAVDPGEPMRRSVSTAVFVAVSVSGAALKGAAPDTCS